MLESFVPKSDAECNTRIALRQIALDHADATPSYAMSVHVGCPLQRCHQKMHTFQYMSKPVQSLPVQQTVPALLAACLGLTIFLSLFAHTAHAARPLVTDDARVVDAKSCQVESWVRKENGEHAHTEIWALPGCNFGGDVEFTLGGGRLRQDGLTASDLVAQAKALVRPMATNSWGAAVTGGVVRHRPFGVHASSRDIYVNVPLSFSFADDQLVLHTNTGWLREGASKRHIATWGMAAETQVSERIGLIAEAFGQVSRDSFYQLGLRFWVVPNRVQIDTTYGNRIGSLHGDQARWFSIGLRLLSPAFLP